MMREETKVDTASQPTMAAFMWRLIGNLLAPGAQHGRLSILIYHRVLPQPDPMFPEDIDAEGFEQQLGVLSRYFNVLPLDDAIKRLQRGSLPPRALSITFDDGYADNAEIALPILRRSGLHATFFIATGFLDGGRMWNDSVIESVRRAPGPELSLSGLGLGRYPITTIAQRRETALAVVARMKYLPMLQRLEQVEKMVRHVAVPLPDNLMLRIDQVRELHNAGMDIGGHTVNHPILSSIDPAEAGVEIAAGKEALEGIIGGRVALFAYPNGRPEQDYQGTHVRMVRKAGFTAAVSTATGVARAKSDLFQLPRYSPWGNVSPRFTLRLLKNFHAPVEAVV
jgi:peptidoglycan/xylan/chitin deacetylase (PgdA/CDA1 family)